jgi:hypothetical protein
MTRLVWRVIGSVAAVAVCLALLLETAPVFAGKPTPATNTAVKVTFRNAPTDRLLSYAAATYVNGEPGVQAAVINASAGWVVLNTCFTGKGGKGCTSQGRYQIFDFGDSANGLSAPFSTPTIAPAVMEIWPFEPDGVTFAPKGFLGVTGTPGETRLAGMKVNFPVGGDGYTVRFTPNMYPGTSYLLVTFLGGSASCTTANPSLCASWSVEAFTGTFAPVPPGSCWTNSLEDIGKLVTMDNSVDFGPFHLPFKIIVSVLPK